jgi:hypothetical protein
MTSFIHQELNKHESHDDFIRYLLEKGIVYNINADLNLNILKYDRKNPNCDLNDPFTRVCRGLVIDNTTREIVCFPPEKSINFQNLFQPGTDFSGVGIEDFIDGTMINLFNYNNQWHISTRSRIGANCSWLGNKSFNEMFEDAKDNLDYSKLETDKCYTFVLRHPENRIVMQYNKADLVFVQVRDLNTLNILNIYDYAEMLKSKGVEVQLPKRHSFKNIDEITKYISDMDWQEQGLVFKIGNNRSKIRNQKYNYVKSMRGNNPKVFYNYLELRNNKMIKEYLHYFPEYSEEFQGYRDEINRMTNLLHKCYMNYRIHKSIQYDTIPYELRPLMYELHGHHLNHNVKITFEHVRNYFNALPIKKIIFIINYKKNQNYYESKLNASVENTTNDMNIDNQTVEVVN